MAVTSGFFNSVDGDRMYNAEQMSSYFDGLISNGVFENVGDKMIVTAGSGMTVNVGTGRAFIDSHWVKNDSVLSLTVDPSDVQLSRIDAVVLRLDKTDEGRSITIEMKTGTPSTTPAPPTPTINDNVHELFLAYVKVPKNTTQITQVNITDLRPSSQCGWVTGIIKQVNTADLFLQWQTAYEEQYAEFDEYMEQKKADFENWFSDLTSVLRVDTTIHKYQRTAYAVEHVPVIPVSIAQYESDKDILFVFVNGVFFTEGIDYTLLGSGTNVAVNFTSSLQKNTPVTFVVIKSVIGTGSGSTGGLNFVKLTQAEYDAMTTHDENTVYIIVG